jgi:hypothetical protein
MADSDMYNPGEGPTVSVSVSFHTGTIRAIRSRVGKRRVSAYVEAAAIRQLERDGLAELVADLEAANGPVTAEQLAAAEAELFGDELA